MSGVTIEILLLLAVAVFLLVRLIGVLGTRDGFEPDMRKEVPSRPKPAPEVIDEDEDFDHVSFGAGQSEIEDALRKAKAAEPSFRVGPFLDGSKRAYEMILMSFMNGQIQDIRPFVESHVYEGFEGAIREREANGHRVEAKFLGLRNIELKTAEFNESTRELTLGVEFEAELNRVVKDRDGNVIDGDAKKVETELDYWEFARVMGSNDPNWQLVATGE